jgi:TRAP transporter TAXI family solute receptor
LDAGAIVGLIAGADTGVKTTRDLKGKKIAQVDPAHLSPYLTNRAFVANADLDPDKDVTWVPSASIRAGIKLLKERKVDVATTAYGAAYVEEVNAARGISWVTADVSPDAKKRFNDIHPTNFVLIKKGAGTGVVQDTWLSGFRRGVHSWVTLPDAVAYTIVETVWNNVDKLKKAHPLVRNLTQERLCTTEASTPFHPGAIKFFKEKGLWTEELEEHQQALLAKKR